MAEGYLNVNSLRLTCKLKRKGKNCLNPRNCQNYKEGQPKKTKAAKICYEMDQNTIQNSIIIQQLVPMVKTHLEFKIICLKIQVSSPQCLITAKKTQKR